ncbi:MAG: spore germination protein [Oscillospiraceae bacterium]|nr:spore germination protein [Oscillospiraceae bacterium]
MPSSQKETPKVAGPIKTWPLQLQFREYLQPEESFDLVERPLMAGPRSAWLYFIDGFAKDEVMGKILEFWMKRTQADYDSMPTDRSVVLASLPYIEADAVKDCRAAAELLFSGALVLLLEGYDSFFILDARTYPVRSVSEPENERVLRGSRDGFVETLIFNTALLRRRIRTNKLKIQLFRVGDSSGTDVALCYHADRADKELVTRLQKKLSGLKIDALTMGQQSLAELLIPQKWFDPFPKVRYTERPDGAAANLLEGRVLILVDNSPSAMILPSYFLDFFQEADDYYFPPLTGSYLHLLRLALYGAALFLTPVFYLILTHPEHFPDFLQFLHPKEPGNIPILLQLLLLELAIDGIKMASLSTPSGLGNSLSIIGGLILGDYAISAGWFCSEVLLYMAFVAMANFIQPNYEMGFAFKFSRIMLLLLTALLGWWGFGLGCLLLFSLLLFGRSVPAKKYFYPLIPFSAAHLLRQLLRLPIKPNRIPKAKTAGRKEKKR